MITFEEFTDERASRLHELNRHVVVRPARFQDGRTVPAPTEAREHVIIRSHDAQELEVSLGIAIVGGHHVIVWTNVKSHRLHGARQRGRARTMHAQNQDSHA